MDVRWCFFCMSLTSRKIEALKPRDKRYTLTDGYGLTLRIYPSGTRSWCLRISTNGRVSDVSLGRWPEVSLIQARQLARAKRKELGQEPPKGYVFDDVFKIWCGLKKGRIVSYKDERRMLERHLLPHVRTRNLDEITAPFVVGIIKPLASSKKRVTLKRVLMRTREILDLAVCAGYIQHNPIERLSKLYAPPVVTPMPATDWRELPEIMKVIATASRKYQVVFLWSLCSMLRPGETANLRWSWLDKSVLTIPANHMKKGRAHRVPLTQQMLALLQEAKSISAHPRSSYIFPSRDGRGPMSSQALAKYLHSTPLAGRLVAHGLRSVARSWMADVGVPYEHAEACLSHLTGSAVSRAYQRSDFLDARRRVHEAWCDHVWFCAKGAGIKLPSLDFSRLFQ